LRNPFSYEKLRSRRAFSTSPQCRLDINLESLHTVIMGCVLRRHFPAPKAVC